MRFSLKWTVVGAFAIAGGFWLAVRALTSAGLGLEMAGYFAFVLGGLAGGAAMTAHAALRPTREPVLAAALALGLFTFAALVPPHSVMRLELGVSSLLGALLSLALLTVPAAAGSALVRRFATVPARGPGPVLLFGMCFSVGLLIIAGISVQGFAPPNWAFVLGIIALVFVAGYLTQALVAEKAVYPAGMSLATAVALFALSNPDMATSKVKSALEGAVFMALIGMWGASRAWKRRERKGLAARPELPLATASADRS